MKKHRIFTTSFASVYPYYVKKAERKGRTRQEVDDIICWLTGYSPSALAEQIERKKDFETFFGEAPALHPNVALFVPLGILIPLVPRLRTPGSATAVYVT